MQDYYIGIVVVFFGGLFLLTAHWIYVTGVLQDVENMRERVVTDIFSFVIGGTSYFSIIMVCDGMFTFDVWWHVPMAIVAGIGFLTCMLLPLVGAVACLGAMVDLLIAIPCEIAWALVTKTGCLHQIFKSAKYE